MKLSDRCKWLLLHILANGPLVDWENNWTGQAKKLKLIALDSRDRLGLTTSGLEIARKLKRKKDRAKNG
jgi:uncharacterized protein YjhX (UPF0386 family)